MATYTLNGEQRDTSVRAKNLLKRDIIPAVVYGKNMDTESIQLEKPDVVKFLNHNAIGAKANIEFNNEKIMVILKDVQRDVLKHEVEHMDFQALTQGEKIKLSIPVQIVGKEKLPTDAIVQELLPEIEIETLPKYLIDHITIDVSKMSIGDAVNVVDLPVSADANIEVVTDENSTVLTIIGGAFADEDEDNEEVAEPAIEV